MIPPVLAVSPGPAIAAVAIVVALAFGLYRALTDGRFRGTHRVSGAASPADAGDPGDAATPEAAAPTAWSHVVAALPAEAEGLGERATLLQFSSAFCAPCRATRRTLAEVAELVPGVRHLEVDAEAHLELVRALDVLRTPTTLVLDGAGVERTRAAGAPRRETVLATLEQVVDPA